MTQTHIQWLNFSCVTDYFAVVWKKNPETSREPFSFFLLTWIQTHVVVVQVTKQINLRNPCWVSCVTMKVTKTNFSHVRVESLEIKIKVHLYWRIEIKRVSKVLGPEWRQSGGCYLTVFLIDSSWSALDQWCPFFNNFHWTVGKWSEKHLSAMIQKKDPLFVYRNNIFTYCNHPTTVQKREFLEKQEQELMRSRYSAPKCHRENGSELWYENVVALW